VEVWRVGRRIAVDEILDDTMDAVLEHGDVEIDDEAEEEIQEPADR
jgi:hypothetical protein